MKKLIAYHGKPEIKKELLKRLRDDAKHDRIVHGQYWENGKGCAVGCTIRGNSHARYETKLGIPESIARLEDAIFEGLENGDAQKFPINFAAAIRPGADLSKVTAKFLVWCLLDKKHGAIRHAPKDKYADCHNAILAVAAIWQSYIKTGVIDNKAARAAAEAAAWAAEAAAWAAARAAAEAAAWAAEAAAWAAAWAAAEAAAWAAARAAARAAEAAAMAAVAGESFWKAAAATLIKLLKAAK